MGAFELAILESRQHYGEETPNCGCACDECEMGHHNDCEYGICWNN